MDSTRKKNVTLYTPNMLKSSGKRCWKCSIFSASEVPSSWQLSSPAPTGAPATSTLLPVVGVFSLKKYWSSQYFFLNNLQNFNKLKITFTWVLKQNLSLTPDLLKPRLTSREGKQCKTSSFHVFYLQAAQYILYTNGLK